MKIRDFYDDPRRAASQEVDFGAWQYQSYGPWRVVWLEATGELVAFNEMTPRAGVSFGGGSGSVLAEIATEIGMEHASHGAAHGAGHFVHLVRHHARSHDPGIPAALFEEVSPLAVELELARLTTVLSGWEEHVSDRDGLVWLAERLGTEL